MSVRSSDGRLRVLILGGTGEATAIARALACRADVAATISFAGRTAAPIVQPVPVRVGGFGGVEGLVAALRAEAIDVLVDATHPFAAQISRHAREAARRAPCRLVAVGRAAWARRPGDRWHEVTDMAAAAAALGAAPRRVFLTIGSLQLAAFAAAPQHVYLVRTVDRVQASALADATFIEARGPFDVERETRLMQDHRIDILVTKNSGGEAAVAKLAAARELGLPVVLVRRPPGDAGEERAGEVSVETALAIIEDHCAAPRRGV